MASKAYLSFLLLSVLVASLAGPSAGVFHIVGAGKGWRIAPNQTYYADWARTRDIHVGDKLMFLYRSGVYDIVEVPTKALFDACSMNNVTMRYQLGPTIIKLTEPGPRYYFCGVGEHCEGGQKVAINVSAEPAAPVGLALPPPVAPVGSALTPPVVQLGSVLPPPETPVGSALPSPPAPVGSALPPPETPVGLALPPPETPVGLSLPSPPAPLESALPPPETPVGLAQPPPPATLVQPAKKKL